MEKYLEKSKDLKKTDRVLKLSDIFKDNEEYYENLQNMLDTEMAMVEVEQSKAGEILKITIKDKKTGKIIFFQDEETIRNALKPKERLN